MNEKIYIVDSTLRDGEEAAGVSFTGPEKIKIAMLLEEANVDIIEAGIPAMGKKEIETLREINRRVKKSEIITWNRAKKEDIDASIDTGCRCIHISAPSSDIQILSKLGKNREWVIEKVEEVVKYSVKNGLIVSFGAEDSSRADERFLEKLYKTAVKSGAKRIRYADTLGILTPFEAYEKMAKLKKKIDAEIDFHGHNDFGMATANALGAFKGGAKYISCSMNGLGERAGNTPLEEIVTAVKYLLKKRVDVDIKKLVEISKVVESCSGRRIWESKPVVGKMVFSHESGIHVDGLIKNPKNYEFFPPEEIGREREIVLGKHSGRSAVIQKLQESKTLFTDTDIEKIIEKLRG